MKCNLFFCSINNRDKKVLKTAKDNVFGGLKGEFARIFKVGICFALYPGIADQS